MWIHETWHGIKYMYFSWHSEGEGSSCSSPAAACKAVTEWTSTHFQWTVITAEARHFPKEILHRARHNSMIIITVYHLLKLSQNEWTGWIKTKRETGIKEWDLLVVSAQPVGWVVSSRQHESEGDFFISPLTFYLSEQSSGNWMFLFASHFFKFTWNFMFVIHSSSEQMWLPKRGERKREMKLTEETNHDCGRRTAAMVRGKYLDRKWQV